MTPTTPLYPVKVQEVKNLEDRKPYNCIDEYGNPFITNGYTLNHYPANKSCYVILPKPEAAEISEEKIEPVIMEAIKLYQRDRGGITGLYPGRYRDFCQYLKLEIKALSLHSSNRLPQICVNCKRIYNVAPKKCECGGKTFHDTHPSNRQTEISEEEKQTLEEILVELVMFGSSEDSYSKAENKIKNLFTSNRETEAVSKEAFIKIFDWVRNEIIKDDILLPNTDEEMYEWYLQRKEK